VLRYWILSGRLEGGPEWTRREGRTDLSHPSTRRGVEEDGGREIAGPLAPSESGAEQREKEKGDAFS
jgi:hypothetical protein